MEHTTVEIIDRANVNNPVQLSVVIPTLNRATVLVEALQSIQNQSLKNFEVLVIDNGPSTDDTKSKVLDLIKCDNRIIYVSTTEKGDFIARNIGCQQASGELILTIDDDWLMTDTNSLQYIVDAFAQDGKLGVLGIGHDYKKTEKIDLSTFKGKVKRELLTALMRIGVYRPGRIRPWGYLSTDFRYLPGNKKNCVDHVRSYCMAFRKQPAEKWGFFAAVYTLEGYSYRGETELCCRFSKEGYRIIATTEVAGVHHVQPRVLGTMARGRYQPHIMFSQARSNTLFFLRNFWSRSTAPFFILIDLLVGSYRHPGLIRLLFDYRYLGKFSLVLASLKGKWAGLCQFYSA